jgi:hypothetical protein
MIKQTRRFKYRLRTGALAVFQKDPPALRFHTTPLPVDRG